MPVRRQVGMRPREKLAMAGKGPARLGGLPPSGWRVPTVKWMLSLAPLNPSANQLWVSLPVDIKCVDIHFKPPTRCTCCARIVTAN